MGHNPLSQGDFLVLENRKGQRNVIKIMQNNEAIQLLHAQSDYQLRLIPLTGDEVQEAISAGRQEVLFSTRDDAPSQRRGNPEASEEAEESWSSRDGEGGIG
jgi:hypothetical protein